MKIENVMERVYQRRRLNRAWQQVEKNAGAAGVDQMTVESFATRKSELLDLIHAKLEAGTYRFKPARRVLIPKLIGVCRSRARRGGVLRRRAVAERGSFKRMLS